jgi:hypothetical protein
VNGATTAKLIIALVAFPVLVHAIFTVVSMVLGLMMPQLAPLAGSWADVFRTSMIVVTFLLAVRASYGVCRRMWPTPPVK